MEVGGGLILSVLSDPIDVLFTLAIAAVVLRWGVFLGLAIADWLAQRGRTLPTQSEPVVAIVPAWNEGRVIERTVRSLLESHLPSLRVLVVDDGSTDDTVQRVHAMSEPRVEVLVQPENRGKPAALNAGLEHVDSRFVFTVDADTQVAPDCIALLLQTARDGADAVCANVRVGNRRSLWGRFQSLEYVAGLNLDRRALHRLGIITTVPGAAALWDRQIVLDAGGFSGDTLAEDTDLSLSLLRQGRVLAFDDRADAFTEAPSSLGGLFRQRRRWLGGNLACIRKHGLAWNGGLVLRAVGIPNLWLAHIGVYVLPVFVSLWVSFGRDGVELPITGALASVALLLDVGGILWFYATDRTDKLDLLYAPLQRAVYPLLMGVVFASVAIHPPRAWDKVERRGTASIG